MVHLAQVGQLVHHHVIDLADGQVDQSPVQSDVPIRACTAPARAGTRQAELLPAHTQLRRVVLQTLLKQGLGLFFQPHLRGITHLGHAGTRRHRHGQELVGGNVLPLHAAHTALHHAQLHRTAQIWHLGTMPPLDGFLKLLGLPLFELLQLGHNPGPFFLHRRVHLAQRHPVGRTHHQAISPHHKTNALAPRAFKTVRHRRTLQLRMAVGGGVGEPPGTGLCFGHVPCFTPCALGGWRFRRSLCCRRGQSFGCRCGWGRRCRFGLHRVTPSEKVQHKLQRRAHASPSLGHCPEAAG